MSPEAHIVYNFDPWEDIVKVEWGGFTVICDLVGVDDSFSSLSGPITARGFSAGSSVDGGDIIHKTAWVLPPPDDGVKIDFNAGDRQANVNLGFAYSEFAENFDFVRRTFLCNLGSNRPQHMAIIPAATRIAHPEATGPLYVVPKGLFYVYISAQTRDPNNTTASVRIRGYGGSPDMLVKRDDLTISPKDPKVHPKFDQTREYFVGGLSTPPLLGRVEQDFFFDKTGFVDPPPSPP